MNWTSNSKGLKNTLKTYLRKAEGRGTKEKLMATKEKNYSSSNKDIRS